jgi:RNA recognition motif-containing protein
MAKVTNNIYAKNFPASWGESEIRDIFEKHGNIKSLFIKKQKIPNTENEAQFAFICYEHEDGTQADKEYGQKCAREAIDQLNGKTILGQVLYVREALTKEERDEEKRKEQLKFKNSKKRCNLYVKNFPSGTKTEELKELFS